MELPPNILNPPAYAAAVQRLFADTPNVSVRVIGEDVMRHEYGMHLLCGVGQGSVHDSQLVVIDYEPDGQGTASSNRPLVFVGKGITFDTGGISLKPSADMWKMKTDMGGSAAVVGALHALSQLPESARTSKQRVVGVIALAENMPDGNAYRPGDVIAGCTGKTAEIINTDAEGRLVLADALSYVNGAAQLQPAAVVDLATLTGAVCVALGEQCAGLFSNVRFLVLPS